MNNLTDESDSSLHLSSPVKITLIYFVTGALWIFLSDQAVKLLFTNPSTIIWVSIYKGWVFIIVTCFILYFLIKRDVTKHKILESELIKSEKILKASELKYKTFIESTPIAIFVIDTEGKFNFVNDESIRLTGFTFDELANITITDFLTEESFESGIRSFSELKEKGNASLECSIRVKNGKELQVKVVTVKISEDSYVGFCEDITERNIYEEKILHSEEKYRNLVESSHGLVWILDSNYIVTFVNQVSSEILGYEASELTGKHINFLVSKQYVEKVRILLNDAIKDRLAKVQFESCMIHRNGNQLFFLVNLVLNYDKAGNFTGATGTSLDITERKKIEEQVRVNEEKYRNLVEASQGLIWVIDKDGKFIFLSKNANEYYGIGAEDLIGRSYLDFKKPEKVENNKKILNWLITNGKEQKYFSEDEIVRPDGKIISIVSNEIVMKDISGDVTGVMGTSLNVTDKKKAEEQVRISEERYRNIVETTNEGIWVTDKDNKTVFVNRTMTKMLGYEAREMIGRALVEFIDSGGVNDSKVRLGLRKQKVPSLQEFKFIKKTGESVWVLINISPIFDTDGNYEGLLVMLTDINEIKKAQDALKESENKYRTLLETSPSSIRLLDLNGVLLYANPQTAVIHGYDNVSEMIGMNLFDLMNGEYKISAKNYIREVLDNGFANGEITLFRKDGSEFPADLNSSLLSEESGKPIGIISIVNDISEKKKARQNLLESEKRLSGILDTAMDAIITTDENRTIILFNKSAEKLFKCSESNAIGKDVNIFIPARFHEMHNLILQKFSEQDIMIRHAAEMRKFLAVTFDGQEIPVETSVSKTDIGGKKYFTVMLRDITERVKHESELKDTNFKLHALASHLQNVREDERLLISRDIHDQVGQELTALKMDIVMLAKEIDKSPDSKDWKSVSAELRAMAELIDKSIKWIRNLSTELRPDVLDRLGLFEAVEWHCGEFEKRSGIKCILKINGDDSELTKEHAIVFFRILQESLTNVVRHSGATRVKVDMKEKDDNIIMMVEDNGKGITNAQLEGSSSLGLLGMKERAYILGGNVSVKGIPNKGTKIEVIIPKLITKSIE